MKSANEDVWWDEIGQNLLRLPVSERKAFVRSVIEKQRPSLGADDGERADLLLAAIEDPANLGREWSVFTIWTSKTRPRSALKIYLVGTFLMLGVTPVLFVMLLVAGVRWYWALLPTWGYFIVAAQIVGRWRRKSGLPS